MLNFDSIHLVFLKGDYLVEDGPTKKDGSHNVFRVFIDATWNLLLTCKREQTYLYATAEIT
jgi:hypothetical protein